MLGEIVRRSRVRPIIDSGTCADYADAEKNIRLGYAKDFYLC